MILCDYEVDVLRVCAGNPVLGIDWGAAMGVALEALTSARLVQRSATGVYSATDAGRAYLKDMRSKS